MLKKALVLSSLLLTTATFASSPLNDSYNIRQKAMGGTQVATVINEAHFYQNPAFLKLAKKGGYSLPRIEMGFNKDIFDKFQDLMDLADIEGVSAQTAQLKKLAPFQFGFKGNINPYLTLVKGGIGFTAFSDIDFAGDLQRPNNPELIIQGSATHTFMAGLSSEIELKGRPIYIGVAPKYVIKTVAYDQETGEEFYHLSSAEIISKVNNDEDFSDVDTYTKSGIGMDFGLLSPMGKEGNGYYGLTIKNVISELNGSKEVASSNVDVKESIPLLVTLGTSFSYNLPMIGKTYLSADYNLVSEADNFWKNIHFGAEKQVKNFLFLRGGLNQGYIVGGLGLNFLYFKLDYAYFVEELGYKLGSDPLTTHNLSLGFSF